MRWSDDGLSAGLLLTGCLLTFEHQKNIFRIITGFFRPKRKDLWGFSWVIYCHLQGVYSKFSFPIQDFFRVNFRTLKVQAHHNMDYSKTSIFKTSTPLLSHIFWNSFSGYWRQNQSHGRAKWGRSRIFAMNLTWDLSQKIAWPGEARQKHSIFLLWIRTAVWSRNKSYGQARRGRSFRKLDLNSTGNWSQNKSQGKEKRGRSFRKFALNSTVDWSRNKWHGRATWGRIFQKFVLNLTGHLRQTKSNTEPSEA